MENLEKLEYLLQNLIIMQKLCKDKIAKIATNCTFENTFA